MAKKQKLKPVEELQTLDAPSLLDEMIGTFRPKDDSSRSHATGLIKNLVQELLDPSMVVQAGFTRTVNERIAAIDSLLSEQLNEIMHNEEFQQLEGSWRGLQRFVMSTETGENQRIEVLNVGKRELLRDFQSATEFTESRLWKLVYQGGYGQYGGDPIGMMVGDFEFGKGTPDIELLQHVSGVAAAAHAPFVSGTAPDMFGMESFTQMPDPRDLAKIFDKANPENTKWLSFRESEDSRYVALTMPHTLGRLPWGRAHENPVDEFDFHENVDGYDHQKYLWSNAAYAMAGRMTSAFADHHWCVAIRGPEGGGKVEDLPIHKFQTREGAVGSKCPTEVLIPEDREKELSDLGFIALINCKNTDHAAFFSGQSTQKPTKYHDADANANAELSSRLPYLMATSRIAHYMKAIARDKIGSFLSRDECQTFLNQWINNYVLLSDNASQEQKAKRPLREAQIQVVDDKARPGCYTAIAHLKPHFQLEELNVSLRLVATLPPAAQ